MSPSENSKKAEKHEMLPLRLHPQRQWEMAQDRLKKELQTALPDLFAGGDLPLDSIKHTLELSRHLFAIMLVLPSSRWLDRVRFWRPSLIWTFGKMKFTPFLWIKRTLNKLTFGPMRTYCSSYTWEICVLSVNHLNHFASVAAINSQLYAMIITRSVASWICWSGI